MGTCSAVLPPCQHACLRASHQARQQGLQLVQHSLRPHRLAGVQETTFKPSAIVTHGREQTIAPKKKHDAFHAPKSGQMQATQPNNRHQTRTQHTYTVLPSAGRKAKMALCARGCMACVLLQAALVPHWPPLWRM
jgi:hypothetical protein